MELFSRLQVQANADWTFVGRKDRSVNDRGALVPSTVCMKSWSDCVPVPPGSSSAHASSVVEFTRTRHDRSSSALTVGRSRPRGAVERSISRWGTAGFYPATGCYPAGYPTRSLKLEVRRYSITTTALTRAHNKARKCLITGNEIYFLKARCVGWRSVS